MGTKIIMNYSLDMDLHRKIIDSPSSIYPWISPKFSRSLMPIWSGKCPCLKRISNSNSKISLESISMVKFIQMI
jgi:hypothetical protein